MEREWKEQDAHCQKISSITTARQRCLLNGDVRLESKPSGRFRLENRDRIWSQGLDLVTEEAEEQSWQIVGRIGRGALNSASLTKSEYSPERQAPLPRSEVSIQDNVPDGPPTRPTEVGASLVCSRVILSRSAFGAVVATKGSTTFSTSCSRICRRCRDQRNPQEGEVANVGRRWTYNSIASLRLCYSNPISFLEFRMGRARPPLPSWAHSTNFRLCDSRVLRATEL